MADSARGGFLAAGIAVAVIACGWLVWQGLAGPLEEAPDFTLTSTGYENGTFVENATFSLSDYEGQTVVLDLMAVNCAACETVADQVLKPLRDAYADDPGFVILSVDTWADPETNQAFSGFETKENLIGLQQERDLTWRHALDTDDVWLKYQAIALPKIVIIGPEQQIVAQYNGVPSLSAVRGEVERAMMGDALAASGIRVPLLGLALLAGVAAFFAPCSVGLVPAYMAMLLGTGRDGALHGRLLVVRTLRGGVATGFGILSIYALLAVLLFSIGGWLATHLGTIQVVTGVALVAIGLLMFRPGAWERIADRLGLSRIDGRRGFFAFGAGYGLASFGCTGPAFLPILLGAFARGAGLGFLAMALYGGALVALMLLAAGLVASGQQTRLRDLLHNAHRITQISAVLFVLAGLYVLWFHFRAQGLL